MRNVTRRRLTQTVSIGILTAVAGCLGEDEPPEDDGEENGDDAESGNEESGESEESERKLRMDEPTEFPADRSCPVCNMVPEEWPEWNAQLVHEDGHREYFDTTGCMAAYAAYTDRFGGPDSAVANAWVTDFETGELVDASEVVFVRVTDPDHVDDVMSMNPTPFADRSAAESFVDGFDEYGEEDIITFEAFDAELAMLYRAQQIEEDHDNGHEHE